MGEFVATGLADVIPEPVNHARPLFDRLLNLPQVHMLNHGANLRPPALFRTVSGISGNQEIVEGTASIMLASNDYLGLRYDPRVIEAAIDAVRKYGTGASGSRLVAGASPMVHEFEDQLADWLGREAVLLFTTGYQANLGILGALLARHDIAICDKGVHASLLDGCRLAGARIRRFNRDELSSLTQALRAPENTTSRACVITDAIYSMDGDTLPIDEVTPILRNSDALFILDEAHSVGITGPRGAGVAAGAAEPERVDLITGALSKAMASCGGYVAGPRHIIDALRVTSRSLMFSSVSVPAAVGAGLAAMQIARDEPEHREKALALANRLRAGLRSMDISTGKSDSLIVPAVIGEEYLAGDVASRLTARGICAGVATTPVVPEGKAVLRFSVTALLTEADIDRALETTEAVLRELGARP